MMETAKEKEIVASDDDYEETVGDHETLPFITLRRRIAAGKSTPSPAWKLEEDGELGFVARSRKSASARKLGANLWEIKDLLPVTGLRPKSERPRRRRDGGDMGGVDFPPLGSPDRPQTLANSRKLVAAPLNQHCKSNERKNFALQTASPAVNSSFVEVTPYNPAISPCSSLNLEGKIRDAGYSSLRTSTELLKVLNHIFNMEEQHASNIALVKSLKTELEDSRACIHELMLEQKAYYHKMNDLVNQVEEDMLVRKNEDEDRMKAVFHSMREDLDDEKRLRRQFESLHRKVGKELFQTKTTLSNTLKDLENERKSNGLLEDLCDVLAKGIKQYEKETRELKENHTMDRGHKIDGLISRISETWLDMRLQTRLGDKNEKITIVNRLKAEMVSFLQAQRVANNIKDENEHHDDHIINRQSLQSLHLNGTVSAPCDIEDDDSISSDLHCFELNMEKTNEVGHDQLKSRCESYNGSIQAKSSSTSLVLNGKLKGKELSSMLSLQTEADHGDVTNIKKSTNTSSGYGCGWDKDDAEDHSLMNDYTVKRHLENSSSCKAQMMHFLSSNVGGSSGNFQSVSGPVQQSKHGRTSADLEISGCSSKPPQGMKENTLKPKLLGASLERCHAHLKAIKGPSLESEWQ